MECFGLTQDVSTAHTDADCAFWLKHMMCQLLILMLVALFWLKHMMCQLLILMLVALFWLKHMMCQLLIRMLVLFGSNT